jgi:hypothetical protein
LPTLPTSRHARSSTTITFGSRAGLPVPPAAPDEAPAPSAMDVYGCEEAEGDEAAAVPRPPEPDDVGGSVASLRERLVPIGRVRGRVPGATDTVDQANKVQ